ncbi:BppU family phage baseplate upper protein [Weissella minor]|uniref:BppU family phage baseplate upper protein n=1 Tax=Weissella minor TaxID=1620 RepID=UPI003AF24E7A
MEKDEALLPVKKRGKFLILDTTYRSQDAMWIDELSGNYGDAGRTIYVAVIEQDLNNDPDKKKAMDLTGRNIRLKGHDAKGNLKRVALATQIINPEAGLAEITIPRNFYNTVGAYQNAAFEVYGENDNVVISSVPVAFEVYNNHVNAVVGDGKPFSDEFDALLKELETKLNVAIDDMNLRMKDLNSQIDTAENTATGLDSNLRVWTDLVNNKGVPLLDGDNKYSGNNEFINPVKGLMTGTTIQSFRSDAPRQDLNNLKPLRDLYIGSRIQNYYSGNQLINNPSYSDFLLVTSERLSANTVYQTASVVGATDGQVLKRYIEDLDGKTVINPWFVAEKWSEWRSLVPYLTKEWMPRNKDSNLPEYRFEGNAIRLRGRVAPKGVIKKPDAIYNSLTIAEGLPFNASYDQITRQSWDGVHSYALITLGDQILAQRFVNNSHQLVDLDNTLNVQLSGSYALN